ncbi:MAG: SDR family NAD(P)-dependent oxidoreductase, partial [Bacteroidales bacterium]
MTKRMLTISLLAMLFIFPTFTFAQKNAVKEGPKPRNVTRLSESYYTPDRFKGKTILVTGGARGIGKYTAMRAVKEGANVVIMDWLNDVGKATTDSINMLYSPIAGGKAIFVYGNIQKDEDCKKAVDAAIKNFGKLDYAVLNAGVMDGVYSGTPFKFDAEQRKLMPAV